MFHLTPTPACIRRKSHLEVNSCLSVRRQGCPHSSSGKDYLLVFHPHILEPNSRSMLEPVIIAIELQPEEEQDQRQFVPPFFHMLALKSLCRFQRITCQPSVSFEIL